MFAFLGVLLVGIGLASGLMPLNRSAIQAEPGPAQASVTSHPEKTSPRPQTARRAVRANEGQRHLKARATLAEAPCADRDTSAVEWPLPEHTTADPARLRAAACEAAGYRSSSPDTTPPESSALSPPTGEPVFITPYDSSAP
jgi:hypothetical protein